MSERMALVGLDVHRAQSVAAVLESSDRRQVYIEGAAQMAAAPELSTGEGEPLREL